MLGVGGLEKNNGCLSMKITLTSTDCQLLMAILTACDSSLIAIRINVASSP